MFVHLDTVSASFYPVHLHDPIIDKGMKYCDYMFLPAYVN